MIIQRIVGYNNNLTSDEIANFCREISQQKDRSNSLGTDGEYETEL
jgi:hypothetical protein